MWGRKKQAGKTPEASGKEAILKEIAETRSAIEDYQHILLSMPKTITRREHLVAVGPIGGWEGGGSLPLVSTAPNPEYHKMFHDMNRLKLRLQALEKSSVRTAREV